MRKEKAKQEETDEQESKSKTLFTLFYLSFLKTFNGISYLLL